MDQQPDVVYVALVPIDYQGVRAYQPGDKVPTANVELHGYEVGVQVEAVPVPPHAPDEEQASEPTAAPPAEPAPQPEPEAKPEPEPEAKSKPRPRSR